MSRRGRGDRGSVTAELALTLPAAVLVLSLMLSVLAWAASHLAAADAASAAARTAAVEGEAAARSAVASRLPDATVGFASDGAWVTATVTRDGPGWLPAVAAQAVAREEG